MPDSETCFLCSRSPSDPSKPVKVVLRQDTGATTTTAHYKLLEVPVPACSDCSEAQLRAKRRVAMTQLTTIVVLTLLGWIFGRGELAMIAFGLGFFISLALGVKKSNLGGKATEHPKVQELLNSGWHFHTP
jgi:hypothetical protein